MIPPSNKAKQCNFLFHSSCLILHSNSYKKEREPYRNDFLISLSSIMPIYGQTHCRKPKKSVEKYSLSILMFTNSKYSLFQVRLGAIQYSMHTYKWPTV